MPVPDAFSSDDAPGWLRWRYQHTYPAARPEDADPETWARRRTPQQGQVTGWLHVDGSGIAEVLSQTVDNSGQVWMQSHLVAGGVHLMRDWTRCTQTELDADLPRTVRELVAEDLGSLEPPGDATHENGQIRWSQPQGVIELRIRQFGASALDRVVQAVSNGTGKLLFEMTGFSLDRVPGPPPDLWLAEADFTRSCQPLDSAWSPSAGRG